jgi:hypothetical protein
MSTKLFATTEMPSKKRTGIQAFFDKRKVIHPANEYASRQHTVAELKGEAVFS